LRAAIAAALAAVLMTGAAVPAGATESKDPPVPKESGTGKRIVYDRSRQRVWLVREDKTVRATYLVSGHKYGTLPAVGRYRVQSKSRHTQSLDGAVSMEFMVRFVYGNTRWIGFHSIPVDGNGQRWRNARTLYDFAKIGTRVVVRQ
jgi:hypothetical protein